MKLTAKQRAQVAELLKCAADKCNNTERRAFADAREDLVRFNGPVHQYACAVLSTLERIWDDWQWSLLEAAARVELGECP